MIIVLSPEVISKIAFDNSDILFLGKSGFPTIICKLIINNQPLTLIATHPCSPAGRHNYYLRNDQLNSISERIKQISGPLILVGDLNITMWSNDYKKFISKAGLYNARKGFGILPSWPAAFPYPLRIPIDHCLLSSDLKVKEIKLADNIGSDHLPVIIDICKI